MIKKISTFCLLIALAQNVMGAISSPADRLEQLDKIKAIVSKSVVSLGEGDELRNPFVSGLARKVKEEALEVEESIVSSPESLLLSLSEFVKPTGIFAISGEYYLMFKEKRLKAGSNIEIEYDGNSYQVTIGRVISNAYTLVYGDATIQQKLK